jgi:hypothetical protein
MVEIRKIIESPVYQGVDEEIAYFIDTEPWGGTPTDVAVKLYDRDRTDVSDTLLSGSASVASDTITTPKLIDLVAEMKYRLEVKFTSSGNIFECYAEIIGEE